MLPPASRLGRHGALGEIHHVVGVRYAGAIGGGPLAAGHLELLLVAKGYLAFKREEAVWMTMVFSNEAGRLGANWVNSAGKRSVRSQEHWRLSGTTPAPQRPWCGRKAYLLDSHVLLWWWFDRQRLPEGVLALHSDAETSVVVSSASVWELSIKHHLGKLPELQPVITDLLAMLRADGFQIL